MTIPLRPDWFHLLRDAQRLTRRLEGAAYQAMETAERAWRAALEAQGILRRRGRRLKVKVPRPQAESEEASAIALCDNWCWLLGEIRQAVEPVTPAHRLGSVAEAKATLETAVELLRELNQAEIRAFADGLQKIAELLAPLAWLAPQLALLFENLDAAAQEFILWAWQHRQDLPVDIAAEFSADRQPVVRAVWEALGLFHRSSSLAESLHGWLRPYL